MRHYLASFMLYAVSMFVAAGCIHRPPTDDSENTSHVAETEAYIGLVPDTATAFTHIFHITNPTADTLRIDRIEPDCECAEAAAEDSVILPGDSASVRMTVRLEDDYLRIEKSARLYLTPKSEPIDICIKAIRPMPAALLEKTYPIRVSDNIRVTATEVCLRDSDCYTIDVANVSEQTIYLECTGDCLTEGVQVYLQEMLEGGGKGSIVIYKDAENSTSHADAQIGLHTSDGGTVCINVSL